MRKNGFPSSLHKGSYNNIAVDLRGQTVKFKWLGSKSMRFVTGGEFAKAPLLQHIWHSCPRKQAGLTPELVVDCLRPLAFMLCQSLGQDLLHSAVVQRIDTDWSGVIGPSKGASGMFFLPQTVVGMRTHVKLQEEMV